MEMTYALLDESSTITIIDLNLTEKIEVVSSKDALCLQGWNRMRSSDNDNEKVAFKIRDKNKSPSYMTSDVRSVSNLQLPKQKLN